MAGVLIAGPSGSGKNTLLQSLLRDDDEVEAPLLATNASSDEAAVASEREETTLEAAGALFRQYSSWRLHTKYYSAPLVFWKQDTKPPLAASEEGASNAASEEALAAVEGIVVTFDLSDKDSFDEVRPWGLFALERESCTLRLCVGTKLDLLPDGRDDEASGDGGGGCGGGGEAGGGGGGGGGEAGGGEAGGDEADGGRDADAKGATAAAASARASSAATSALLEGRRRAYLDWCLDHGFEYIEADCTDAAAGGGRREKEGVPRVLEAFQSNMWTNMQYRSGLRPIIGGSRLAAVLAKTSGGDGNVGGGVVCGVANAVVMDDGVSSSDSGKDNDGDDGGGSDASSDEGAGKAFSGYDDMGYAELAGDGMVEGGDVDGEDSVIDLTGMDGGSGQGYIHGVGRSEDVDFDPFGLRGPLASEPAAAVFGSSQELARSLGADAAEVTDSSAAAIATSLAAGDAADVNEVDAGATRATSEEAKALSPTPPAGTVQLDEDGMRLLRVAGTVLNGTGRSGGSGGSGSGGNGRGGGAPLLDMNRIESLMVEVQQVRATALGEGLSDAQRRERAAATAMKLMELLLLGEDDEGGGSDDSDAGGLPDTARGEGATQASPIA